MAEWRADASEWQVQAWRHYQVIIDADDRSKAMGKWERAWHLLCRSKMHVRRTLSWDWTEVRSQESQESGTDKVCTSLRRHELLRSHATVLFPFKVSSTAHCHHLYLLMTAYLHICGLLRPHLVHRLRCVAQPCRYLSMSVSTSSSSSPAPSPAVYEEVKQPAEAVPPSLSNSVVFVNDNAISRPRPADTPVMLTTSTSPPSDASKSAAALSEPFGPPSAEWAAAASTELSPDLSSSPSDDPFASSTADPIAVSSSVEAFAAFPKPGHVEEHQPEKRKKKKKKQRAQQQQPTVSGGDNAAGSGSIAAFPSDSSSTPASASDATGGEGGLLMADSAEYVAMLEQRLERLKKKQEARIKAAAAKTTRRTSQQPITTPTPAHPIAASTSKPLTRSSTMSTMRCVYASRVRLHHYERRFE